MGFGGRSMRMVEAPVGAISALIPDLPPGSYSVRIFPESNGADRMRREGGRRGRGAAGMGELGRIEHLRGAGAREVKLAMDAAAFEAAVRGITIPE
jgi:hypothetical protein